MVIEKLPDVGWALPVRTREGVVGEVPKSMGREAVVTPVGRPLTVVIVTSFDVEGLKVKV
jgi:hypothetical protein